MAWSKTNNNKNAKRNKHQKLRNRQTPTPQPGQKKKSKLNNTWTLLFPKIVKITQMESNADNNFAKHQLAQIWDSGHSNDWWLYME